MLTKIQLTNPAGAILDLPLQDVSNGYTLKDITGLDPVKATIVSTSYAGIDGTQFQSTRRDARNLVLKIGFSPDWANTTPKLLRDNLYKWLMTKMATTVTLYEDSGLVVDIAGHVESNAAPRFSSDPDVTASIICDLPDFIGMTNELISGSSVPDSTETTVNYVGTSETGFLFTVNVNRAISGFSLYMRGADGVQRQMDFAATLNAGDVVQISTVPGSKFATLISGGVSSSILYGVSPFSPWLTLQPGVNKVRLLIAGAAIPYTIAYTDKYGGL